MLIGAIVGLLLVTLFSSVVIWIVGKLGLGIELRGFGAAFLTGLVIAVVSAVTTYLLGAMGLAMGNGLIGAVVHLILAALTIQFASSIVKGLKVKGFGGAVLAALCIAALSYAIAFALRGALPAA